MKTKKIKNRITRWDGQKPRLSVFRSNRYIYAQIVDDSRGKTVVSASTKDVVQKKVSKTEVAAAVGKILSQRAKKAKISVVSFDRGRFKYQGRVKALAEEAKKEGLKF